MARKKKEEELDLNEEEMELDEQEEDEELELEPEEISADASIDEDEEEEQEAPKKRAPRKRAKKEPKVEAAEEVVAEEKPVKKAPKLEEKIEKAFEMPAAAAVAAPVETVAAVVTPAPAHDDLAKQWAAAQQTSASIVASLEKVNTLLRDVPEHYAVVLQKAMKQSAGKPSPAAKVAFGMSLVATVLSVLSLTFSQSARQQALSHHGVSVPAIHQQAPQTAPRVEANANTAQSADALAAKPKKQRKAKVQ